MSSKKTTRSLSFVPDSKNRTRWLVGGFALGFGVLLIIGYFVWRGTRSTVPFSLIQGEQNVVVLLRNNYQADYTLRYEGSNPTRIDRVIPMIQGELLHVDVEDVYLIKDGQEFLLATGGYLNDSDVFQIQPGESFEVRIIFKGQTLGGNYLYGFRFEIGPKGQANTVDLVLDGSYTIFVE